MIKSEVTNDQFYTKDAVAYSLIKKLQDKYNSIDMYVEPSAGSGSFYDFLPETKRIGLDIDPKHKEVRKQDFFSFDSSSLKNSYNSICVVGNPPFGKNSSLAIKFFNHSAMFAKYIAFIVPRTFRKESVINRLDKQFHLEYEEILEKKSFKLADDTDYSVPCTFQIWEKKSFDRKVMIRSKSHKDWSWVSKEDNPKFAIRRVGVNAGKIFEFDKKISSSSHYFIECDPQVFNNFKKLFDKVYSKENNNTHKYDTVGNPSISMSDLVEDYSKLSY
jgi:hypothetical protein